MRISERENMDPGTSNEGHDRQRWETYARRSAGTSEKRAGHLDELTIAAFLDRRLDDAGRQAVEDHLADCPECAAIVHESHDLLAEETQVLVPRHVLQAARALVGGRTVGPGVLWRNTAWWSAAAIITLAVGFGGYRVGHSTLPEAEVADRLGDALSFSMEQGDFDLDAVLMDLPIEEGTP
jgi:anti-sigma factor RsiW